MANFVVKKDGTKEPFDAEKIKKAITAAATQANLPEEEITKAVEQVSATVIQSVAGKEEVETAEIKEKILSELDIAAPSASEAWRKYEQGKQE